MKPKGYIYSLSDPQSGAVRYIGQTVDVRARERAHTIFGSKRRSAGAALGRWIAELSDRGLRPVFAVLETCVVAKLCKQEDFHIAQYRSKGAELLNVSRSSRPSYKTQCGLGNGVKCLATGHVFASKAEAARSAGCSQGTMCNWVKTGLSYVEL